MARQKKTFYFYPFLVGLFPVISLLGSNATEVNLTEGFRAVLFSILLSTIVYLLIQILVRKPPKTALLTTFLLILFYSYGHLHLFLETNPLFGLDLARVRFLVPLYAILLGAGSFGILKINPDFRNLSQGLTVMAVVALLLPLAQIGLLLIREQRLDTRSFDQAVVRELSNLSLPEDAPNIYYIVLDGYSRADMLANFGYDNSSFIQELASDGFYIANCSQANYSWTLPSMASTFNMQYLDGGDDPNQIGIEDDRLYAMLDKNIVRETLENMGYSVAAFENGFDWLQWYDADRYYSPVGDEESFLRFTVGLNGFELLLLETTAARLILDTNLFAAKNRLNMVVSNPREIHRQRVLHTLEMLPEVTKDLPGPVFIYAHIVSPHDPYLFGPNGEHLERDPENSVQAFLDQTTFINTQITQVIDEIIETDSQQSVIILQGDHGAPIDWPEGEEENKLGILTAVYFPGREGLDSLYPSITPVNIFRLVFKHFFNADLDPLSDYSILGPSSPLVNLSCND